MGILTGCAYTGWADDLAPADRLYVSLPSPHHWIWLAQVKGTYSVQRGQRSAHQLNHCPSSFLHPGQARYGRTCTRCSGCRQGSMYSAGSEMKLADSWVFSRARARAAWPSLCVRRVGHAFPLWCQNVCVIPTALTANASDRGVYLKITSMLTGWRDVPACLSALGLFEPLQNIQVPS